MSMIRIAVAGAALSLAAGCASTSILVPEEEYGSSVRHMIQTQTWNPEAVGQPPQEADQGLDGEKAGAAVKDYRTSKPPARRSSDPMGIIISD